MEVGEVEYDAVREIVKADVVIEERLSSINHLDVVQLILVHGLEDWDLHFNSLKI